MSQKLDVAKEKDEISDGLAKAVFELNIVTSDYLLHPSDRALRQWGSKQSSIGKVIETAEFDDPEEQALLREIKKDYESINNIFSQLTSPDVSAELKDRLVGQLLVRSQNMIGGVFILAERSAEVMLAVQKTANIIIIIFIITISILIAGTWLMMTRVSVPLQKLTDVTKAVGKGNFKVKVDIKTKDELQELGNAMNSMISDLHKIKLLKAEKGLRQLLEKEVNEKTKELNKKLKETEDARMATMNILEDIEEARERLEEEDVRKSELFNITSHELKTPLVPIKGYLGLVLDEKYGKLNDNQKNALGVVSRNTERLKALIEDVLDIARLQAGRMKLNIESINPTSLVREAVEGMRDMAKERKISLKHDIKPLPKIKADKNRLVQVITNLVKNAIKFTEKGGVTVDAYPKGREVIIEVTDTGIGIAPENQEKVFQRFFQVDSSITRKYGGTGLGLPISRGIIENFGGTLTVKSKIGKGSTFIVKIPLKSYLTIGFSYGLAKKISETLVTEEESRELPQVLAKPESRKKEKHEKEVKEEIDKVFR